MALVEVRSETAGSIWRVLVNIDDIVQTGDVLVLVELMKMEIPIVAPCAGRVEEIFVTETNPISSNQPVMSIEASDEP
jgi:biotin carboxyl carrier protein